MNNLLFYFTIFIYGACIGSFINVIVYRLPNGISIIKGKSFCQKCKAPIKNYDLIPILSYLTLSARCRQCKQKISIRYPLLELLTGLIAVNIFTVEGFTFTSIYIFIISSILIAITFIDLDTMTIPNVLIIALIPASLGLTFLQSDISLLCTVIGIFIVSTPMFFLNLMIADSFGGGDIKLIAVGGLMLGSPNVILAIFIAIVIGGLYGVYLLLSGKNERSGHIAFAPYICIGIYIALLYGNEIIDLYISMLLI